MAYLFNTDAVSEVMQSQPLPAYLDWLRTIPREDQFVSAITLSEVFSSTFRLPLFERHLKYIQDRLLPAITVMPFDYAIAREYGRIRNQLESTGFTYPDTDIQIAATAVYHDLALVTGDIRHFRRIKQLRLEPIMARARNLEVRR